MLSTWITSLSVPAVGLALATASEAPHAAERGRGVAWWVWLLILLAPLALAIWWWLRKTPREVAPPAVTEITLPEIRTVTRSADPVAAPVAAPLPAVNAPAPEAATPDDLTRIEGIGPVISRRFHEAGIATFAQLAAADVDHLEQILSDAKLRLAKPATWPEQARLAAAGDWEALAALQAELKGGRRV